MARENNMDPTLTYMYLITQKAKEAGVPIKRSYFQTLGRDIEYFPGVEDYFERINAYGQALGITVQHYVISSGNREIIEGCKIYPQFKEVFASEFHYDKDGNADWPAVAINYTGKTQFLFRISKDALNIYDSEKVNTSIDASERDIPFTNMIYLGDGMTDVPCMRLVKANGGYSIGIYTPDKYHTIQKLVAEDRVNFACNADYRNNSQLDMVLKGIITKIALENNLKKYQKI